MRFSASPTTGWLQDFACKGSSGLDRYPGTSKTWKDCGHTAFSAHGLGQDGRRKWSLACIAASCGILVISLVCWRPSHWQRCLQPHGYGAAIPHHSVPFLWLLGGSQCCLSAKITWITWSVIILQGWHYSVPWNLFVSTHLRAPKWKSGFAIGTVPYSAPISHPRTWKGGFTGSPSAFLPH